MAGDEPVKVSVVFDRNPFVINCSQNVTAEDLCIILCKKYKIPPLTRTLFALRIRGTEYFLKDNSKVLFSTKDYELRIRFKVPRLTHLKTLDETTYDYYFQQARNDVYENKIPELKYPEHKDELLGLGIMDMIRAVHEDNLPTNEVVRNYKKYIPKVVLKKHGPITKKHAHENLQNFKFNRLNLDTFKNSYLQQLYSLAPNYLSEQYENVLWKKRTELIPVKLMVAPFHPQQPGIRLFNSVKSEWVHICTVDELIYMTRNGDCTLEILRRGTPIFIKFKTEQQLSSFISVCDGYYRLMAKWTFNLSKDDETPSLLELQRIKCHGPVGGAFSYRKLEEKRAKKHGCYILRQCQDDYNVYYLDVCTKNNTTETYKIEFKGHCYEFNKAEYYDIDRLKAAYNNPEGRIYLNECIPPSEYDKSQLLLCGEPQNKGLRIDQTELQEILKDNKSPRCLPSKDILLYRGSLKTGSEKITATYKALWKLDETRKIVVAFKALQKEKVNDHLKDFIELAGKWACLDSSSIVRLYGITLELPNPGLVLEYLTYGPFDEYLKKNKEKLNSIHLMKAAAHLARALWGLSEAGIVHGDIRCCHVLLAVHDGERIIVKLSGPTLRQYTANDVHWIPVDFFSDMILARRSVIGDIWAFATTLWEVFSYGESPAETKPYVMTAKSYAMGGRLERPHGCPSEVFALMRHCWQSDPLRPQEIMRDMNRLLQNEDHHVNEYMDLDEVISNHEHDETVSSDIFIPSESDAGSNKSLISVESNPTSTNGLSDYYNRYGYNKSSESLGTMTGLAYALRGALSLRSNSSLSGGGGVGGGLDLGPDVDEYSASAPRLMESIQSQGKPYVVSLTKKIGSGNYGHVFKGWMESDNQESHRKEVAVKKLTRSGTMYYEDFENELKIMKSLQHINIVEILGYSSDHTTDVLIVMEYVEEGSLNKYLKFQGDKLQIGHLIKYCKDIASGMDYISAKNMVHRDLATRNILVVNKYHVKISDFGLARVIPKDECTYRVKSSRLLLPFSWYAPESTVEPYLFSTESDVWSYGVTAWEIFSRALQEVPEFDLKRPTERASCFQIPDDCPSEIFRHLMTDCWNLDPKRRPRFIDLVYACKRFLDEYK